MDQLRKTRTDGLLKKRIGKWKIDDRRVGRRKMPETVSFWVADLGQFLIINPFHQSKLSGVPCKNLFTVCTAIFAANSTGKLYPPVDMEGNAIDLIPLSIASFMELK